MATFADFALFRAEQSYGGAEVLRAQRVLPSGASTTVHLALFGDATKPQPAARIIAVAEAAAQTAHDQVARILEVGAHEGALYATALAADGVDINAVLDHDRKKRTVPDVAFAVAVALELGQVALDLQERGDVWAAEAGAGLSSLFPGGLRLDALVLGAPGTPGEGKLTVRILAGAAADPARPTAYRAPELRNQQPSVASDVFVVAQVLRALLSGDASATSAPRFAPQAAPLGPLLAAALTASPDERLGLFMLVERLGEELRRVAGKSPAAQVATSFLKREYRALVPPADDDADEKSGPSVVALRSGLVAARARLRVLWPRLTTSAPAPALELDLEALATAQMPLRFEKDNDSSSAIGRVFDDIAADDEIPITQPIPRNKIERARALASATISDAPGLVARRAQTNTNDDDVSTGSADAGKSDEDKSIAATRVKRVDRTSESDPPWISMSDDYSLVSEASGAPPINPSEIESGPTVETRTMLDIDDDDDIATDAAALVKDNNARRPR